MALDARFAPALGFLPVGPLPSFERAVMTFLRAVGRARFGAGAAVADRDRRQRRAAAPSSAAAASASASASASAPPPV